MAKARLENFQWYSKMLSDTRIYVQVDAAFATKAQVLALLEGLDRLTRLSRLYFWQGDLTGALRQTLVKPNF